MSFKGAIFDLDGTILDSMPLWSNLCRNFLKKHGREQSVDIDKKLEVLSIRSALKYICELFPQLDISLEKAWRETMDEVAEFYREKVTLRPGIMEILDELAAKNIPAGIVTATESELVKLALQRVGLQDYFAAGILSCSDLHTSKKYPDVFLMMAGKLHASPAEIIVFEDALYASVTAKKAGFALAAVYDLSEKEPDELRKLADWYCRSWEEFPGGII